MALSALRFSFETPEFGAALRLFAVQHRDVKFTISINFKIPVFRGEPLQFVEKDASWRRERSGPGGKRKSLATGKISSTFRPACQPGATPPAGLDLRV